MVISLPNIPIIKIPFLSITGSLIKADENIPLSDEKNEYMFYIIISCVLQGKSTNIIFSRKQKQRCVYDPIALLHYSIQHLSEKIQEYDKRNEKYDQRAEELAVEREKLLKERADTIDQMKEMLHSNSDSNLQQTTQAPQPLNPTNTTIAPNNFDEIKKFKDLLDSGIITQEEFDTKKKQLLGL
jgi:FtsZ-binding cell division protein ZapB